MAKKTEKTSLYVQSLELREAVRELRRVVIKELRQSWKTFRDYIVCGKEKRCGTCKWKRDTFHGAECALASSELGVVDYPESKAIAHDGDMYSAWLTVSDDFGCVMWEEKVRRSDDG